jgi:hypothetical protein
MSLISTSGSNVGHGAPEVLREFSRLPDFGLARISPLGPLRATKTVA